MKTKMSLGKKMIVIANGSSRKPGLQAIVVADNSAAAMTGEDGRYPTQPSSFYVYGARGSSSQPSSPQAATADIARCSSTVPPLPMSDPRALVSEVKHQASSPSSTLRAEVPAFAPGAGAMHNTFLFCEGQYTPPRSGSMQIALPATPRMPSMPMGADISPARSSTRGAPPPPADREPRNLEKRKDDMRGRRVSELLKELARQLAEAQGHNAAVCCMVRNRELYPHATFGDDIMRFFSANMTEEDIMREILQLKRKLPVSDSSAKTAVQRALRETREAIEKEVQWYGRMDEKWWALTPLAMQAVVLKQPADERILGVCQCTLKTQRPLDRLPKASRPLCTHWQGPIE
ncbi:hypothetical protein MN608_08366 [Microdochium nivale]|nr:hypothetical protein MN608_08366 [Microdochium nivale]